MRTKLIALLLLASAAQNAPALLVRVDLSIDFDDGTSAAGHIVVDNDPVWTIDGPLSPNFGRYSLATDAALTTRDGPLVPGANYGTEQARIFAFEPSIGRQGYGFVFSIDEGIEGAEQHQIGIYFAEPVTEVIPLAVGDVIDIQQAFGAEQTIFVDGSRIARSATRYQHTVHATPIPGAALLAVLPLALLALRAHRRA